ncbi:MAG: tetratricopeptide repeat protein [Planctomycetota bacterium]|nr:tetratricopeptide repeat protein [Planctomycetota bacterium]
MIAILYLGLLSNSVFAEGSVAELLTEGYQLISKGQSASLTFQSAVRKDKVLPLHWVLAQKNDVVFHRLCGDMAMAYKIESMNEEALQLIEAAIADRPEDITYLLQLGDLHWEAGNIGKAYEAFDKALEINPKSAAAWHGLARCLQDMRKPKEAIRGFEQAIEISPENPKYIRDLARLLALQGLDMKRALELYRRAASLTPEDTQIQCSIGWIYHRTNKITDALKLFVRETRHPNAHHSCWYGLGTVLVKMDRLSEAVPALKQACDLDPTAPGYAKDLGNVYFRLKQYPEATSAYRNALAASFDDDPVTWHSLGLSLEEQNRLDEALASYKTAASIDPSGDAFADQMHVLIKQSKFEEALEIGREASALGIFDQKKRKAGLVNPRYVHRMMAEAYNRMKLYEQALKACDEAESVSRKTGGGVYHLCYIQRGDALAGLGKIPDARNAYKTARRGPEGQVAEQRLRELEE